MDNIEGITLTDQENNNVIRNNIIVDNTDDGIDDEGTGNTYDFNFYYGNSSNDVEGGSIGDNSIIAYGSTVPPYTKLDAN